MATAEEAESPEFMAGWLAGVSHGQERGYVAGWIEALKLSAEELKAARAEYVEATRRLAERDTGTILDELKALSESEPPVELPPLKRGWQRTVPDHKLLYNLSDRWPLGS